MDTLTPRQREFVELYLGGMNATEAYKLAGYKVKNDNVAGPESSKLLRNPKISQEITRKKAGELAERVEKARKYEIDQDWLISQYIDTINGAREAKQYNAVRNCITDIAKLTGHLIDKKELAINGEINHLQQLDTQTLLNALQSAQNPQAIEGEYRTVGDD